MIDFLIIFTVAILSSLAVQAADIDCVDQQRPRQIKTFKAAVKLPNGCFANQGR